MPKIIPQPFVKGSVVMIHPRWVGRTPRGLARHARYTLTADVGPDNKVHFQDRHGFPRELPLAMFVEVTPAIQDCLDL